MSGGAHRPVLAVVRKRKNPAIKAGLLRFETCVDVATYRLSTSRTCSSDRRGRQRTRSREPRAEREHVRGRVVDGAGAAAILLEVHVEAFDLQRHGRRAEEVQERVGGESVLDTTTSGVAGAEIVGAGAAVAIGEAAGAVERGCGRRRNRCGRGRCRRSSSRCRGGERTVVPLRPADDPGCR